MQFGINTFQVRQRDFLFQDHLIEADNEVRIKEPPVENCQSKHTANELEVVQMFRIDTRRRIDLKRVVVVSGVLE